MSNLSKLIELVAMFDFMVPDVPALSQRKLSSVLDEFANTNLGGIIEKACFNPAYAAEVADAASTSINEAVLSQLSPMATAIVAAATGENKDAAGSINLMTRGLMAVKIIRNTFPGPDIESSLQAAFAQLAERIALKNDAVAFGTSKH